ncbi:S8 family peptidase [Rhizobium leguminosarum]|uniref:S8 family peptidase n=1 Tax=Rhizobium leguminosarum TaxID=384 RepID=UPI001039D349|nr:S8 family serine peptidase [Rhizobium leguminosarum]MBY5794918.1 S8 family serine peptidase [Rhizobium leguminosarum]NKK26970.1 S8 family serine peptidase [Rhizobium leguminosarum bv. viciae]NKK68104.1 S8 family serine peptidase [Rhizobium leguminosarum bv. viciae]TBZ97473.1 hypothetical protein E0H57_31015 [Rhizobium leguminosarum bv. viciae]
MNMLVKRTICGILILFLAGSFAANAQVKIDSSLSGAMATTPIMRAIIVLRPDPEEGSNPASSVAALSEILGAGAKVRRIGDLPIVTAELTREALLALNDNPNVALVTADVPVPPSLKDSGPLIGADKVHSEGVTGEGYAVAVLDTGVEIQHPALKQSVVAEACFSTGHVTGVNVSSLCPGGFDFSTNAGAASKCPATVEGCEHGTHVAGIIAGHNMIADGASFEGIAPAAKIIAVQVFSLFNDESRCRGRASCVLSYTSDQLRALEWVYKQRNRFKIAAVNMSLGGGYHDTNCDQTSALTEIIERLKAKGIATVVAAGNDDYNDAVAEPACISSTISVSALDKHDQLDVSYTNVAKFVHIAAPGTAILSSVLNDQYETLSGTSMAAPHVAAAFALLKQRFPNETVKQLEARLTSDAPIAVDPRQSELVLPILDLAHVFAPTNQPSTSATTANTEGLEPALPDGTSFIIKSPDNETDIKARLSESCADAATCEIKPVSPGVYRLDVAPNANFTGDDLKSIVKPFGGQNAIFKNGLSTGF